MNIIAIRYPDEIACVRNCAKKMTYEKACYPATGNEIQSQALPVIRMGESVLRRSLDTK